MTKSANCDGEPFEICPARGWTDAHPRDEFGYSTFEICDCCGIEFGYEDSTPEGIRTYRERWLTAGARWFKLKSKPDGWSLELQLANLFERYQQLR